MKFEAYNYQCSPAEWDGGLFTDEARQFREESLKAMAEHLSIIDRLFTDLNVAYPMTAQMALPFKEADTLRLLRLNTRKRPDATPQVQTELCRPFLIAKMLYSKESFYVLSVQNMTMLHREVDWVRSDLVNMPSCIVIIANTEGRQLLLVESNSAFSKTKIVAKIFQDTLQAMLLQEKLNINFRPHYSSGLFWEHMERKAEKGIALKSLKCHFDYPNMAEDAKLLGSYFEELGVEMNAEMDYTLKGQHGQPLNIDPKHRNMHIASIVDYAGKTGNRLQSNYFDQSRETYDADHVGISTLVATDKIQKKIKELIQEALVDKNPTLMPLNDDNGVLRDDIAVWLRGLDEEVTGMVAEDIHK